MYLRRVEIYGFKSFADKIELEFVPGITAIVGPNGSGKSNVADAIRWVLGEQSPKVLRSSKMEDVIFAGTESRKPVGMAEVSLILDNCDRALDLDFSEIRVTRRMFKSGESEYFLNKVPCRLKDIQDIFMDTGIGKEGYSIIGQGRIDQLLSGRPEERRDVFEEAAGIMRYKTRKLDAQKKLAQAAQNIARIDDVLLELSMQIAPLAQESQKAKQYLQLQDRLKVLDINIFLHDYNKFKAEMADIEQYQLQLKDTVCQLDNQQQAEILVLEDYKRRLALCDERIVEVNKDILNINRLAEKLTGSINADKQQIEYIDKEIERLKSELKQEEQRKCQRQKELYNLDKELEKAQLEREKAQEQVKVFQKQLEEINSKLSSYYKLSQAGKDQVLKFLEEEAQLQSQLGGLTSDLNATEQHLSHLRSELEKVYTDLKELELLSYETVKAVEEFSQKLEQNELIEQDTQSKILYMEKCQRDILDQKTITDRALQSEKSKLKLLEEMENNLEGFTHSVKLIIQRCTEDKRMADGIFGPVGKLIQVEKPYQVAVETALGASIQYLVTRNEDDAHYAIDFLKSVGGGRATFLPISSIKSRNLNDREKAVLSEEGCLGVICNLVKFEPRFKNIFNYLLGRIVLCVDLRHAINIAKKFGYVFQIVTLDGDVVGNGGYISGGSIKHRHEHILGRTIQIQQFKQSVKELEQRYSELSKQADVSMQQLNSLYEQQRKVQEEKGRLSVESVRMEETLKSIENKIAVLTDKRISIENQLSSLLQKKKQLEQQIDEYSQKIEYFKLKRLSMTNDAEIYQEEINELQRQKEEIMQRYTEVQIKVAAMDKECISLNQQIERFQAEIVATDLEAEKKAKMIQDNIKNRLVLNKKIEEQISKLNAVNDQNNAMENQLNQLKEEKALCNKQILELQDKLDQFYSNIADIKDRIHKYDMRYQYLEEQLQRIQDDLWESYELSYAAASKFKIEDLELTKALEERKYIKEKIKAMGMVNTGAIDEYDNLCHRIEFLEKQRDDLRKAIADLEKLIRDLDAQMKKQFLDQFVLINQTFNRIFRHLFNGGKAELILDGDDVLNADIEIIVQPPGKRLQNMMLLSGGERALTAIAVFFALLEIRPSPFCVLDEIEAALDEANVRRFARFLKEYSEKSQFIVITHRRATAEISDALYGVAMPERGVSKLISVKLNEKIS